MNKKSKEQLKGLSVEELETKVREGSEQMFRLRFQMSMGQGEGLKKYRELRKERAVLLTLRSAQGVKTPVVMAAPKGAVPAKKARKPRLKKA